MTPTTHVSEALRQTRRAVALWCAVVGVCALLHLLAFGFVHYTEVRYTNVQPSAESSPLSVVDAERGPMGRREYDERRAAAAASLEEALDANRVLGPGDRVLEDLTDASSAIGVIATFGLLATVLLGCVVAGGGQVPGAEKVIGAGLWSIALAGVAFPWRDAFGSVPFPGLFSGYESLSGSSAMVEAGRASGLALFASHVLMPLAAAACATVIGARYREGVRAGVIVTAVSQLDEEVDREIARIRERGPAAMNTVRTVGALNRAIGAPDAPASAPASPAPAASAEAAKPKGRGWVSANDRRIGQPDPGDGLRRPI